MQLQQARRFSLDRIHPSPTKSTIRYLSFGERVIQKLNMWWFPRGQSCVNWVRNIRYF